MLIIATQYLNEQIILQRDDLSGKNFKIACVKGWKALTGGIPSAFDPFAHAVIQICRY